MIFILADYFLSPTEGTHINLTVSSLAGWKKCYHNTNNQTWGFVRGSLSFVVNPCDSSKLDSDYRLCWTSQSDIKQGSGDRCGSIINLQNSNKWERLIYYIV